MYKCSKHWDPKEGFTLQEARRKKEELDSMYGTKQPTSRWKPAEISIDPTKVMGYIVTVKEKE